MGRSDYEEAVTHFRKLPDWYRMREGLLGHALAKAGHDREARQTLAMVANRQREPSSSFNLAVIHFGLGETDEALNYLEQTYEEQSPLLIYLQWPLWDDLRSRPRFQDLHRRMNFPETVSS